MTTQEAESVSEATEVYSKPDRYSVFVDFDGVINSYVSGWIAADTIPDPPVEGAIEWLNELSTVYETVIFTTRARYPEAHGPIMDWLREHGFTGQCRISCEKGPAIFYLDDRAWRFKGTFPSMEVIRKAFPWRVGDEVRQPIRKKLERKQANLIKLENALHKRKHDLRELREMASAVVEYYSAADVIPEQLQNLKALLEKKG